MPPTPGRRSRVQNTNYASIDPALFNALSVPELRSLCRNNKISSTGNRATLLARLRGSGLVAPASNDSAREQNLQEQNLQNNTPPLRQDHAVNANASDSNFTEEQLNTIRRIVQESIGAASREIANEAALAAVQVLQPNSSTSSITRDRTPPAISPVTQQQQQVPRMWVNMPHHFRIFLLNMSRTYTPVISLNYQSSCPKICQLWMRKIIWCSPLTTRLSESQRKPKMPLPSRISNSGQHTLPHI